MNTLKQLFTLDSVYIVELSNNVRHVNFAFGE